MRYRATRELRTATTLTELKALSANIDPAGGFMIAGELLNELLKLQARTSAMRRLSRIIPDVAGEFCSVPTQNLRLVDATWSAELVRSYDDATTPFGQLTLKPHPLTKGIKVTGKVLRSNPLSEQFVLEMLADAMAVPEELAFVRGDGAGQPLGLLNTPGLLSVTTATSGTLVLADLAKWAATLPAPYQDGATALLHTDSLALLLQLGVLERGQLFGRYNVAFSDQMPSAGQALTGLTSATTIGVIGDFRQYLIADGVRPAVLRLNELYSQTDEVGFMVDRDVDGGCAVARAFVKLVVQ